MINARDASAPRFHKILAVGEPGAGKSAQIATLPGKKFVYAFDPGTLPFLVTRKIDADVEEFLPDVTTVDFSLRGFNRGSKSDKPKRTVEPVSYVKWEEHFNENFDKGFFQSYDWLVFDSLTMFTNAMMNRLLFLNNRLGDIQELSDYRVVGSKLAQVFTALTSMKMHVYATGHIQSFQDEVTKRVTTQLGIPGASRDMLPKLFSNIWLLQSSTDEKQAYTMLTRAEPRGFQAIRTVIPNLPAKIDITIKDWSRPELSGIGAVLKSSSPAPAAATPKPTATPSVVASGTPTPNAQTQPAT